MKRGFPSGILLYILATMIVAGSNFLAAPLLLKLLGIEGFADWSRLEPIVLVALPLVGFGVQLGMLNLIRDIPDVAGTLLPFHLASAAAIGVLVASFAYPLFGLSVAVSVGVIVLVEGGIMFMISYWRATDRPGWFATFEGGRSATVMLALLAMTMLPRVAVSEMKDYIYLRAGLGAMFFGLALLMTHWSWRPDLALVRRAVKYGLPLILSSVAVTTIMNFDRYAVDLVEGSRELAAYVAHVKTTQILGSALAPFFIWFAPVAIKRLQTGALYDGFFGQSFFVFMAVNFALALGLWLVSPVLWPVLFPGISFAPALMAPLVVGMVIFAAGNPISVGSLREGRTSRALLIALLAALFGVLAVLILAPIFGSLGVAWAKAIAMLTYTAAFGAHTVRSLRIVYPWVRIVALGVATTSVAFVLTPVMDGLSPLTGLVVAAVSALGVLVTALVFAYAIGGDWKK